MKKVKIYTLSDPTTKEIRYVGKTELSLTKRLYYHIYDLNKSKDKHKINWFNKILKNGLKPIITLVDEVPHDEWKFWEKYWISQFKTWGFKLINYLEGGNGFSSEDVKKLWKNKNYREFHTNRVKGDKNPFYGKSHSDDVRKILRVKCPNYGKANGNYGKTHPKEVRDKMRDNQPNLKKVIRLDLDGNYIDEWNGIKFMCRELNLDDSAVIRVMKGKAKTHKGFKFKYRE